MSIYDSVTLQVKLDEDLKKQNTYYKGVRHGDVTSPKVFTLAMQDMFRNLNLNTKA